ncbi:ParB/RepB/Spo0J family partition protein [Salipiger sp. 1_MG-2023]|uniref:ParB/RepB/Spo0J family partition protein n=1 Tax=Salipiger sp. 1_MG-2023 TaxID=3062665 RepID=UPI0026E3C3BA|nr:ParB/RepB/Spo0J family partition protein [Salipiger sp. 1_MG-2023]MDO6587224.1 ParB/RepB/Spo0J family partition protein [Salipiger sp. 1_MG-2023]
MARKPKLGLPLQTLRNAPDAQEGRLAREAEQSARLREGITEIPVSQIDTDGRLEDRLSLDLAELQASIAAGGQRVPILVRPGDGGRYQLIYGRRRLAACEALGLPVRAIVADLDDDQALKDQLLENQARRDLSFIERALVAAQLLDSDQLGPDLRSGRGVAEVLGLTEAAVSQLLGVVRAVGPELIAAIGAAPGIGRPRWEELKKRLDAPSPPALVAVALQARDHGSDAAFLAVLTAVKAAPAANAGLALDGIGTLRTALGRSLRLELRAEDKDFARWLEAQAPTLLQELHARWKQAPED